MIGKDNLSLLTKLSSVLFTHIVLCYMTLREELEVWRLVKKHTTSSKLATSIKTLSNQQIVSFCAQATLGFKQCWPRKIICIGNQRIDCSEICRQYAKEWLPNLLDIMWTAIHNKTKLNTNLKVPSQAEPWIYSVCIYPSKPSTQFNNIYMFHNSEQISLDVGMDENGFLVTRYISPTEAARYLCEIWEKKEQLHWRIVVDTRYKGFVYDISMWNWQNNLPRGQMATFHFGFFQLSMSNIGVVGGGNTFECVY